MNPWAYYQQPHPNAFGPPQPGFGYWGQPGWAPPNANAGAPNLPVHTLSADVSFVFSVPFLQVPHSEPGPRIGHDSSALRRSEKGAE